MSHYVLTQSTLLTHVPVASTLPHVARKGKKDGRGESGGMAGGHSTREWEGTITARNISLQ